jgi:hypothetical protein
MECYLPGDDSVFNSDHPFAHPDFRWSRNTSLYDSFESLFSEDALSGDPNALGFTIFDMFTLIHRMLQLLLSLGS